MDYDEWTPGNSAGPHLAPVTKLVLHTTEGSSLEGACAAYKSSNSWPHMTVDARPGVPYRICGHLGFDVAGRALKNLSGGVETNTAGVIQVEVVGSATSPGGIDWEWIGREVVGPVATETGIPLTSTVTWVAYPASYGKTAPQRLSPSQWTKYKGILGHQHVPENDHGDPGAIPIQTILDSAAQGGDMPLNQSDLNAIRSIVRESLVDFDRLPVIWAGQSRPTHWYWYCDAFKVLVTSPQAHSLVDNALAEWSGSRAADPDGIGQAAIVPDDILALAQTIGPDNYPGEAPVPPAATVAAAPRRARRGITA